MEREQEVQRILEQLEAIARGQIKVLYQMAEALFFIVGMIPSLRSLLKECPCSRKPARLASELKKFKVIEGGKK